MKRLAIILGCCLCLFGCSHREKSDKALMQREFYQALWERFDYVRATVEIDKETTFDLTLKIAFTDDYAFDDFSMVFTVFDSEGDPYRSKGYKFNLKDADGQWNCEKKDGCYTFVFPINKALRIADKGTYTFQVENRMPKTPLEGVKEMALLNH